MARYDVEPRSRERLAEETALRVAPMLIPAAALVAALPIGACAPASGAQVGDPGAGRVIILRESCGSCHRIPGVVDADGLVGPPLTHFAQRTIIAGVLSNTPASLVLWLKTPQAVVPGSAMPDMGLTDRQARDVAAYLYTLK